MTKLVTDLITPLIAAIGGKPNFSDLSFTVHKSRFLYGDFINAVISFVIIAAAIYFLVVLPLNKLAERRAAPARHRAPRSRRRRPRTSCCSRDPRPAGRAGRKWHAEPPTAPLTTCHSWCGGRSRRYQSSSRSDGSSPQPTSQLVARDVGQHRLVAARPGRAVGSVGRSLSSCVIGHGTSLPTAAAECFDGSARSRTDARRRRHGRAEQVHRARRPSWPVRPPRPPARRSRRPRRSPSTSPRRRPRSSRRPRTSAAQGVSAAAEQIDKATGGKYADKISAVSSKLEDALDRDK